MITYKVESPMANILDFFPEELIASSVKLMNRHTGNGKYKAAFAEGKVKLEYMGDPISKAAITKASREAKKTGNEFARITKLIMENTK